MEEDYLEKLSKTLQKDLLAEKTVRNYTHSIKKFIEYFNDREIKTIKQDDVASYIRFLEERRHLKPQSINLYLNAIAYFLDKVVESPIDTDLIPRKKRSLYDIPDILSPDEIKLIFDRLSFLKHKIMIMLAYGCGMTPSQICNVKVSDLNFEHKRIKVPPYNVHKKSIVMVLPDKIIPLLLQYIEKDKPSKYLFESRVSGKRYDTGRIINYAFSDALEKAGIHKKISLKDLRNSYIIHLRDHGYPLEPVLETLGINGSTTFKRFCQIGIAAPKIIPSPLDLLYNHDNIDPIDETVIRNLISKIPTEDEKDYFNEAAKCLKVGALRAAVILIWEAAIRNVQQRCLRYQSPLNAALKTHYPKAKQVDSIEDFAYIKESLVIEASNDIGIFDKNEKATLKDCLDLRNHCGHPSNYSPGTQKVMAYIEDIVRILYK